METAKIYGGLISTESRTITGGWGMGEFIGGGVMSCIKCEGIRECQPPKKPVIDRTNKLIYIIIKLPSIAFLNFKVYIL